jgi:hypothetical protein
MEEAREIPFIKALPPSPFWLMNAMGITPNKGKKMRYVSKGEVI